MQYRFCYSAILHAARLYQDGSRQLRRKMSAEVRHLIAPCHTIPVTVCQHSIQAYTSPSHVCYVPTIMLRYLPDKSQQSTLAAPEADPVWLHDDLPSAEVSHSICHLSP